MILGIGIDAVDSSRIARWMDNSHLLERFFHVQEVADSRKRGASAAFSLAARFAAKEAYGKALGTGLKGITLKNILVTNNADGRPYLTLFGDALQYFTHMQGKYIHLSLTHERNIAIACVILEGDSLC